jgi:hypothetical protein
MHASRSKRLVQRRSVAALAGFGFLEFGDDVPFASVQVVRNSGALRLNAKATLALIGGGNAKVADETAGRHGPSRGCYAAVAAMCAMNSATVAARSAALGSRHVG